MGILQSKVEPTASVPCTIRVTRLFTFSPQPPASPSCIVGKLGIDQARHSFSAISRHFRASKRDTDDVSEIAKGGLSG